MRTRLLPLIMLGAGFGAGCEPEPVKFPSMEYALGAEGLEAPESLLITAGGGSLSASVRESGIVGPGVNLGRYDERGGRALRGVAFGRPVNLKVRDQRVSGVVGTLPLDLTVTRENGALRVRGLVEGRITDFRIGMADLSGSIGPCGLDLRVVGGRYEGLRSCGGRPEAVRVQLPPALAQWSDAEIGAVLGIMLSAPR